MALNQAMQTDMNRDATATSAEKVGHFHIFQLEAAFDVAGKAHQVVMDDLHGFCVPAPDQFLEAYTLLRVLDDQLENVVLLVAAAG